MHYEQASTPRSLNSQPLPQNVRPPFLPEERRMRLPGGPRGIVPMEDQMIPYRNAQVSRRVSTPQFNPQQIVATVEGRIIEMNRWLMCAKPNTPHLDLPQLYDVADPARCDEHILYGWWEKFTEEFFEGDATFRVSGFFSGIPKSFVVSRSLIPRYFRHCFENGMTNLQFILRQPVTFSTRINGKALVVLYPNALTRTEYICHGSPYEVIVSGPLEIEMNFATLRVRSWAFEHSIAREMIDKELLRTYMANDQYTQFLISSLTDNGLPNFVLQFLEINTVMESIRLLVSHARLYSLDPFEALRALLVSHPRNDGFREPQQPHSVDSSIGRPTSAQSDSFEGFSGKKAKKTSRRITTPTTVRPQKRRSKKSSPAESCKLTPSPMAPNAMFVNEPKLYVMDRLSDDTKTIHRECNETGVVGSSPKDKTGSDYYAEIDVFGDLT